MRRTILRTISWLMTVAAAGSLFAWAIGRIVTDRWGWSQYVYWMPTPVVLGGCVTALLTAAALAWLAERPTPAGAVPVRWDSRARAVVWLTWAGALAFMLMVEWHAGRYVRPVVPAAGALPIRVLFWNTAVDAMEGFEDRVIGQRPDVVVLANAPRRADWGRLRNGIAVSTWTARDDRLTVVSRYPVLCWGSTDLKVRGSRPRVAVWRGTGGVIGGNISIDTGQGMFVELDTTPIVGHTTVVWALDLPSDMSLARRDVMREAAAAVSGFAGPTYRRDPSGLDAVDPVAPQGFPTPDLIVGDFNTPRGSASLAQVAGTMPHAFDQAGRGFSASWPIGLPLVAIDQAFVGPRWRAIGYQVLDLGGGEHRAEVVDLVENANR